VFFIFKILFFCLYFITLVFLVLTFRHDLNQLFVLDLDLCHDDMVCYILDKIFYLIQCIDKYDFLDMIEQLDSTLLFHYNKRKHLLSLILLLYKNHIHLLS